MPHVPRTYGRGAVQPGNPPNPSDDTPSWESHKLPHDAETLCNPRHLTQPAGTSHTFWCIAILQCNVHTPLQHPPLRAHSHHFVQLCVTPCYFAPLRATSRQFAASRIHSLYFTPFAAIQGLLQQFARFTTFCTICGSSRQFAYLTTMRSDSRQFAAIRCNP